MSEKEEKVSENVEEKQQEEKVPEEKIVEEQKEEKDSKEENSEDESQKYMRLMAEFQNFKKRTEKEKQDIYAFANEKIVVELLNVIDNFERALQHSCSDEKFTEGMKSVFKMLKEILDKNGLEEIEALGKDFDPNFHNAVMTGESSDYESGKVMEVMQKGYKLKGKVIRASMVKVVE